MSLNRCVSRKFEARFGLFTSQFLRNGSQKKMECPVRESNRWLE